FTANGRTAPVATSTRTTWKPTGWSTFPTSGAMSPNWATNASPSNPKAALVEKSRPLEEEWTPRWAAGRGGSLGTSARRGAGGGAWPGGSNRAPSKTRLPAWSGQPYHAPGSTDQR